MTVFSGIHFISVPNHCQLNVFLSCANNRLPSPPNTSLNKLLSESYPMEMYVLNLLSIYLPVAEPFRGTGPSRSLTKPYPNWSKNH